MALVAGQVPISGYQIPDYTRVGQIAAEGAMAPFQVATGLIEQYKNYQKEQKEAKKQVSAAKTFAKALKVYTPEMSPILDETIARLSDENIPISERLADSKAVGMLAELGTLGAKQRAIAVQEQQAGMRSGGRFFGYGDGGGGMPATVIGANAGPVPGLYEGLVGTGTEYDQYTSQFNQLGELAAASGADPNKLSQASKDYINATVAGDPNAVKAAFRNMQSLVPKGAGELEGAVEIETPSGDVISGQKDKAGTIYADGMAMNQFGEPRPRFSPITNQAIVSAMGDYGVLPPLPQEDIPVDQTPIAPSGQGEDVIPAQPEAQVAPDTIDVSKMLDGAPEGQQYTGGYDVLRTDIPIDQMSPEQATVELERTTSLTPFQRKLADDAVREASQKLESVPTDEVEKDMKFILLTRKDEQIMPPTGVARVLTDEQKKARANTVYNMGRKRYAQRAYAREIIDRYARIQKILNHPQASEFFGQNVPQKKLNEFLNRYPDIASELETLKGQDLVKALQGIKEKTGTVAQTSDTESKAYQASANSLNINQSWTDTGAKGELFRLQALLVREGKRLGMNESLFAIEPKFDAQGNRAGQRIIADEIRKSYDDPLYFQDEVDYFTKISMLRDRVSGGQQPGQPQAAPQQPSLNQAAEKLRGLGF